MPYNHGCNQLKRQKKFEQTNELDNENDKFEIT